MCVCVWATYLGEDVAGFVQSGDLEPVILLHESKASRVGLDLGGNGPKEAWKHLSVREGGGGGSIGDLCSAHTVNTLGMVRGWIITLTSIKTCLQNYSKCNTDIEK